MPFLRVVAGIFPRITLRSNSEPKNYQKRNLRLKIHAHDWITPKRESFENVRLDQKILLINHLKNEFGKGVFDQLGQYLIRMQNAVDELHLRRASDDVLDLQLERREFIDLWKNIQLYANFVKCKIEFLNFRLEIGAQFTLARECFILSMCVCFRLE